MKKEIMLVMHDNEAFSQAYVVFGSYKKPIVKFIGLEHEQHFLLPDAIREEMYKN